MVQLLNYIVWNPDIYAIQIGHWGVRWYSLCWLAGLIGALGLVEGTVAAIRDRLRPILMTSIAFGFGVLPLALATGAGSGAQRAIGTGVIGGMLAGTFLGIFFIPLFFVSVRRVIDRLSPARGGQGADSHD